MSVDLNKQASLPLEIGSYRKYHNTLFICPSKFCISIVFVFSWDHCKSQEKLETMLMQNLEGQAKSIKVFSKVAYYYKKCRLLSIQFNPLLKCEEKRELVIFFIVVAL